MKIKEYALTGLVIFLMFALLASYSEGQKWKTKYLQSQIEINENQNKIYQNNEKTIIKYKEFRQKNGSLDFIVILNTM